VQRRVNKSWPLAACVLLFSCSEKRDTSADSAPGGADSADSAAGEARFSVVGESLPSAFLSIWGSGWDDVWMVGGDVGAGPAVARFDGDAWSLLQPGGAGDLWWVFSPGGDDVWMVGAGGRALRYDREGTFHEEVLPGAEDYTLFGIWGAAADDLWAVGGDVLAGRGGVWRYDGASWRAAEDLPAEVGEVMTFKVWGAAADDVWIVGTGGLAMRWDGSAFTVTDTGEGFERNLFTVSGAGGEVWAVGGYGDGNILRWGGGAWADEVPDLTPQLNGVYAAGADDAVACGAQGAVVDFDGAAWTLESERPSYLDYHACWIDGDGAVWAAGGSITSAPLDNGVVVYGGDREIPALNF